MRGVVQTDVVITGFDFKNSVRKKHTVTLFNLKAGGTYSYHDTSYSSGTVITVFVTHIDKTPVVTFRTTRFHIQKSYVLPTQCIYVFCVDLRTNSDYFPIHHSTTGFL